MDSFNSTCQRTVLKLRKKKKPANVKWKTYSFIEFITIRGFDLKMQGVHSIIVFHCTLGDSLDFYFIVCLNSFCN